MPDYFFAHVLYSTFWPEGNKDNKGGSQLVYRIWNKTGWIASSIKKGGFMLACILFTSCMQKTNRLDVVARCSPKGMKKSLSLYRVQWLITPRKEKWKKKYSQIMPKREK